MMDSGDNSMKQMKSVYYAYDYRVRFRCLPESDAVTSTREGATARDICTRLRCTRHSGLRSVDMFFAPTVQILKDVILCRRNTASNTGGKDRGLIFSLFKILR
jgi:hypothetical protein